MFEKYEDCKNHDLWTGESQLSIGSVVMYVYQYIDIWGVRKYEYAPSLNELREKEMRIQRDIEDGIDYAGGEQTVIELSGKYLAQKKNLRQSTMTAYHAYLALIHNDTFGSRQVRSIKPSEVKKFFVRLHDEGRSYSTIRKVYNFLHPIFEMAVEDCLIRCNPLSFTLTDVVPNDTKVREALTSDEKERFLAFIHESDCYREHLDWIVILLGTGLRISEFCGLTEGDLDFQQGTIHVQRQLTQGHCGIIHVGMPKTSRGIRKIPMSDAVRQALLHVMQSRKSPEEEPIIDGCTGFLFLTENGKPKQNCDFQEVLNEIVQSYNGIDVEQLPKITPHTLRHTFFTDISTAGMNAKLLQYIMGV